MGKCGNAREYENVVVWNGNMKMWKFGSVVALGVCKYENVEAWECANMKMWKLGSVQI